MREHYRLVLSQSRRMLGVTEDAEDVTQAVFVKTWKAWDGFEGNEAQRRAWLLRITRNATVDAAMDTIGIRRRTRPCRGVARGRGKRRLLRIFDGRGKWQPAASSPLLPKGCRRRDGAAPHSDGPAANGRDGGPEVQRVPWKCLRGRVD